MTHKSEIEEIIEKSSIKMDITRHFKAELSKVWEGLTDTEHLSKLINTGPAEVQEKPVRNGVAERHIYWKNRFQRFVEEPYVWEHGKWYGNLRKFGQGPMNSMSQLITFTEEDGGVTVRFQLGVQPNNNPMGLALRMGAPFMKRQMQSIFNQIDFKNGTGLPLIQAHQANASRLEQLSTIWSETELPKEWVNQLIEHIETGLDTDLANIEPYELVHRWAGPLEDHKMLRKNMLEAMLLAVRGGLMSLHWNLICPGCRGPKEQVEDLKNLKFEGHCESCNIRFGARFAESVCIGFRPQESVRKIQLGLACQAGPKRTPHQLQAQYIESNETVTIDKTLVFENPDRLILRVEDGDQSIELHEAGIYKITQDGIVFEADKDMTILNELDRRVRFIIQQETLPEWILTAAQLIRSQDFIDHFSHHILAPDLGANVGTVTLMFSDLVGSTKLYQEQGDAGAFAAVVDHFKILKTILSNYDGVLVKTVGDAIMAVFEQPEKAVLCGIEMQKAMLKESELGLRLGLHVGPCLAVTLNERLDYFGATVNQAARMEGQCKPGQLVLSDTLYNDPEVKALVETDQITAVKDQVKVKGIEETLPIHRIICN